VSSAVTASTIRPAAAAAPELRARLWRSPKILRSGVGLAVVTCAVAAVVIVLGMGGWRYYTAPLDVRAYTDLHRLLRPSGAVGVPLGMAGLVLMTVMHLYTLRKRFPSLTWMGPLPFWLEFHIYCGIVGPFLITLHTSFKFNGIVSVAFWSMLIVVASGFVGRYLYVHIPRSIRGRELTHEELDARVAELWQQLDQRLVPPQLRSRLERFEAHAVTDPGAAVSWLGLFAGELLLRARLVALGLAVRRGVRDRALVDRVLHLTAERAILLRRIACLKKTRRLFDLWRVYHKPLAILMGLIVVVHVALVVYLGYAVSLR